MLFVSISLFIIAISSSSTGAEQQQYRYDEELAHRLMFIAAGAYFSEDVSLIEKCVNRAYPSENWTVMAGNSRMCDIIGNTCSFYTIRSEQRRELILVFRGTMNDTQLFLEGWTSTKPGIEFYGIGKVNFYFYKGLQALWPTIQRVLSDPNIADYKVTFTGHSLGGALASIASIRAVLEKFVQSDHVVLYTFGQPRVGSPMFAIEHNRRIPHSFRVVNSRDIVPHLPLCAKLGQQEVRDREGKWTPCNPNAGEWGYYHHGTEIWYQKGMTASLSRPFKLCLGEPRGEDFKCSDSLVFEPEDIKEYIHDHRFYFGQRVPSIGEFGCQSGVFDGGDDSGSNTEAMELERDNDEQSNGRAIGEFAKMIKQLLSSLGQFLI